MGLVVADNQGKLDSEQGESH